MEISRRHFNLVKILASQVNITNHLQRTISKDDIIQEGNIALFKAYKYFDKSKGVKLDTYVYVSVRRAIYNFITKVNKKNNVYGLFYDDDAIDNFNSHQTDKYNLAEIRYIISTLDLTSTQLKILNMKIQGYTFREIGIETNMSHENARRVLKKIIKKIKTGGNENV